MAINWKELEKFTTVPGKVVTLVVMIDGIEQFALSFSMESLAFKEILEKISPAEVKIAEKEKITEKKPEAHKPAETAKPKGKGKGKKSETPKIEPEPMDDDDNDDNDEDQIPFGDDKPEDKPVETFVEKTEKELVKETVQQQENVVMAGSPTRMTRDQIMNSSTVPDQKPTATEPAKDLFGQPEVKPEVKPEEKPAQQAAPKISDEW
jgi:hypothetical protein